MSSWNSFWNGVWNTGMDLLTGGTYTANKNNYKVAQQNLAMQEKWNTINYRNQLAQQEYQKGIQQQIFQREDTAQQRAVKDLMAAGLSPTLAAGNGAGAGSVVDVLTPIGDAPQNQYQANPVALSIDLLGMAQGIQQIKATQQNIDYAKEHGLPVGAMPARTIESWLIEALDPYAKQIGSEIASKLFGVAKPDSGAGERAGDSSYNPPSDKRKSSVPPVFEVGKVSPDEAKVMNIIYEGLLGRTPYSGTAYDEFNKKDYRFDGQDYFANRRRDKYYNQNTRSWHYK